MDSNKLALRVVVAVGVEVASIILVKEALDTSQNNEPSVVWKPQLVKHPKGEGKTIHCVGRSVGL